MNLEHDVRSHCQRSPKTLRQSPWLSSWSPASERSGNCEARTAKATVAGLRIFSVKFPTASGGVEIGNAVMDDFRCSRAKLNSADQAIVRQPSRNNKVAVHIGTVRWHEKRFRHHQFKVRLPELPACRENRCQW